MLRSALLGLILSLAATAPADARLFWQTYGSTIPAQGNLTGSGGSTWNWNQDYFVPRYASTCRYDLFSHCKIGRTRSPAARFGSQLYPGYCTVYGACHYLWRNHVYQAYCGSTPLQPNRDPWRNKPCCPVGVQPSGCLSRLKPVLQLPGLQLQLFKPAGLELLGSIPVDSENLLAGGLLPTAPIGVGTAIPESITDQLRALQPLLGAPPR